VLCRKLLHLSLVVNSFDMTDPIMEGLLGGSTTKLVETVCEIFDDSRHGVCDQEGMLSVCLEIIREVCEQSGTLEVMEMRRYYVDRVIEYLGDWDNKSNLELILHSLRFALEVGREDADAIRPILSHFPLFSNILSKYLGVEEVCSIFVELLRSLVNYFHKLDMLSQMEMTNVIMLLLLHTSFPKIRIGACLIISKLEEFQGVFVFRNLSRDEVEDVIISMIIQFRDNLELLQIPLNALVTLAKHFNPSPGRIHIGKWCYPQEEEESNKKEEEEMKNDAKDFSDISQKKKVLRLMRSEGLCNILFLCMSKFPNDALLISASLCFASSLFTKAGAEALKNPIASDSFSSEREKKEVEDNQQQEEEDSDDDDEMFEFSSGDRGPVLDVLGNDSKGGVELGCRGRLSFTSTDNPLFSSSPSSSSNQDNTAQQGLIDEDGVEVDEYGEPVIRESLLLSSDPNYFNPLFREDFSSDAIDEEEESMLDEMKEGMTSDSPSSNFEDRIDQVMTGPSDHQNDMSPTSSQSTTPTNKGNKKKKKKKKKKKSSKKNDKNNSNRRDSLLWPIISGRPSNDPLSAERYRQIFTPLLPKAFNQLTNTSQYFRESIIVNEKIDLIYQTEKVFEMLAEHTLEALHTFLGNDPAEYCEIYRELFSTQTIAETVPIVMARFGDNQKVQKFGLDVISSFATNGVGMSLLGQTVPHALVGAIGSNPQDKDVHMSFSVSVEHLARYSG